MNMPDDYVEFLADQHNREAQEYRAEQRRKWEQRVREIVREEIARIVSALDDYSEDGIVRVSTLRDVLTRGKP